MDSIRGGCSEELAFAKRSQRVAAISRLCKLLQKILKNFISIAASITSLLIGVPMKLSSTSQSLTAVHESLRIWCVGAILSQSYIL